MSANRMHALIFVTSSDVEYRMSMYVAWASSYWLLRAQESAFSNMASVESGTIVEDCAMQSKGRRSAIHMANIAIIRIIVFNAI